MHTDHCFLLCCEVKVCVCSLLEKHEEVRCQSAQKLQKTEKLQTTAVANITFYFFPNRFLWLPSDKIKATYICEKIWKIFFSLEISEEKCQDWPHFQSVHCGQFTLSPSSYSAKNTKERSNFVWTPCALYLLYRFGRSELNTALMCSKWYGWLPYNELWALR